MGCTGFAGLAQMQSTMVQSAATLSPLCTLSMMCPGTSKPRCEDCGAAPAQVPRVMAHAVDHVVAVEMVAALPPAVYVQVSGS